MYQSQSVISSMLLRYSAASYILWYQSIWREYFSVVEKHLATVISDAPTDSRLTYFQSYWMCKHGMREAAGHLELRFTSDKKIIMGTCAVITSTHLHITPCKAVQLICTCIQRGIDKSVEANHRPEVRLRLVRQKDGKLQKKEVVEDKRCEWVPVHF